MRDRRLTHVDAKGRARMVDVSAKAVTVRRALAEGSLSVAPETLALVRTGRLEKGDALAVARLAGIQGAKRASDWIPLCHPVRLDAVTVTVEPKAPGTLRVVAEAVATDRTGVEMEALAAVAAACLALYDMVKAVDRGAEIRAIRLLEKSGGRSGTWRRRARRGGRS